MPEMKDCGSMRIERIVLDNGTKLFKVTETVGAYFENPQESVTFYTRTNSTFDYTIESVIE